MPAPTMTTSARAGGVDEARSVATELRLIGGRPVRRRCALGASSAMRSRRRIGRSGGRPVGRWTVVALAAASRRHRHRSRTRWRTGSTCPGTDRSGRPSDASRAPGRRIRRAARRGPPSRARPRRSTTPPGRIRSRAAGPRWCCAAGPRPGARARGAGLGRACHSARPAPLAARANDPPRPRPGVPGASMPAASTAMPAASPATKRPGTLDRPSGSSSGARRSSCQPTCPRSQHEVQVRRPIAEDHDLHALARAPPRRARLDVPGPRDRPTPTDRRAGPPSGSARRRRRRRHGAPPRPPPVPRRHPRGAPARPAGPHDAPAAPGQAAHS